MTDRQAPSWLRRLTAGPLRWAKVLARPSNGPVQMLSTLISGSLSKTDGGQGSGRPRSMAKP